MTKTAKVKVSALDTEIQIHLYGERPKPPKRQEPIEHSLEFWSYSGEIMMTRYNDETSLNMPLDINLDPDELSRNSGCSNIETLPTESSLHLQGYNGGQICDKKCRVTFSEHDSEITKDGKVIGRVLGRKTRKYASYSRSLVSKDISRTYLRLSLDQHFCDAGKIGKQDSQLVTKSKNVVCNEPNYVIEALGDKSCDNAMQEELNQFIANDVRELVPQPKNMTIIDTKWGLEIRLDETKQTALAISTTESEYISAGKACQQALWMRQALIDYDIRLDDVPIMCDNKGAIDLSKNPVQHSRTKHIEIRHYFLHDNVQKGHVSIEKVSSVDNIADILTKPLKRESFNYLRLGLGMMEHIP
ncbi:hypothetical protein Tco_0719068 [Tanacetum coccineum]